MTAALAQPTEANAPYHVDFTPDSRLYPFESRWFDSSVGRIHYIDEGEGRPILLMHGNPDWSFLYRKMIPLLTPHFRCVAMDYPGFGLSVHPVDYNYLPSEHAKVVAELVEDLDLTDAIVVGQDWGGPIGYDVASRMPDRFSALVAGNTMMWAATPFFMQRTFSKLMAFDFVQKSLMKRHTFVKRIMPSLLQSDATDREMAHYIAVAPSPHSRKGHAVFPKAIVSETAWLNALEARVKATLADKPMLRIMGMRDVPLTTKAYLRKWDEMWPGATKLDLPDAGHFWQEDEPVAAAEAIIRTYVPTSTTTESTAMTNNTLLITLAQPKADQTETFHGYVGASTDLALKAGGEVSSRFAVRQLIGETPAAIFGLATFPSASAITTMFDSPAYQQLVPARERSIDSVNAYIVHDTPIAEIADPEGAYMVVVASPNPEAMDDLQSYQTGSGPIFAKHGGKPAAQLPVSSRPVGDTPAAFVAIIEFPTAEAAQAVFEDPDYQSLIPARDRGLASLNVYLTT